MSHKSSLFLIDGHALCYRSFYAIRELSSSKGQATNAIFGFVNTLRKILREYQPGYLGVCFDVGKKTHRQEKFADYKIHRPPMPEDLRSQIPIIKEIMGAFNIPVFTKEGYEADDLIATITKEATQEKLDVVIVTEDKDLYQLVNKNIKFLSMRKDTLFDEASVQSKLGFPPHRIIDFIGLAGDTADNIPGVVGIGEVTARKLINQYETLEGIFEHIDEVSPAKVQEKLINQKDSAVLSKELAILCYDVPLDIDMNSLKLSKPNKSRLVEIFKELELQRLAETYAVNEIPQEKIYIQDCEDDKNIFALIKEVERTKKVSFLIEEETQKIWLSDGSENIFIISLEKFDSIRVLFENKDIEKIVYDLKAVLKILAKQSCELKGDVFDVMLAGYVLKPVQAAFTLNGLVWEFFKESLPEENKEAYVVRYLYRLKDVLSKELESKNLTKLFEDIEMPLAEVLFKMESEGVCLDSELLQQLSKECGHKIEQLTEQIYAMTGEEFNLNSPKQLSYVLFEKLKLPVIKKTKTGFSTNETVLKKLALKHDVPVLILEYRGLAKLKSTYIDALPKLVSSETGRIHTEFHQTGTETGRLSSRHPNLQNIPIRTELGRQIRKAIVSSGDNILISADYSQIELRVLAHLSGDKNLIKAFQEDQDIHQFTASLMFDVDEKDVTSDMRSSAKRINFGIVYGMGAFSLAKDLNISQKEAQGFIDRYFLRYPDVKKFLDGEIKKCEEKGYVLTILNRRRYIPEIHNKNMGIRQFAQRQATNTPVQGSAADLMKLSMINVQKELEKRKLISKMTVTVHDELIFDVPKNEEEEMTKMVRDVMEHAFELCVPMKVSIKSGKNWLEMKGYE